MTLRVKWYKGSFAFTNSALNLFYFWLYSKIIVSDFPEKQIITFQRRLPSYTFSKTISMCLQRVLLVNI